ncbi:MAG TPA: PHP domain-containing protein [Patescibacteria group bacterium]|nr:PHP domain-containing protein [Patescibacteria group bacterium]
MSNLEIAQLFKNVAAAYTIIDERKYHFQIVAYQKAADVVERLSVELKSLHKDNKLDGISGIGPTIKQRLDELFTTGRVAHFDEVLSHVPYAIFPLLDIPSFGPKKAYKLVTTFKLKYPETVIEDVKKLATDGRIAELEGFGEKSEKDILQALSEYATGTTKTRRMLLPIAYEISENVLAYLRKSKDVIDVQPLGSLRRMAETVGDVDIAATSDNPQAVIDYFVEFPHKERLIEKGPTTASFLIGGGRHVDLLVLPPEMFGSMLQHFTGSKHHNVALREYSLKKGYSLSERGVKFTKEPDKPMKTFKTEESFYKFLGMDWIPPEIRDNVGEIDRAIKHTLPKLVELKDIKGDLHIHSDYQIDSSHDYGNASMQQMLTRAKELKYEYLGFSEHNPAGKNNDEKQICSILEKRAKFIEKLKESNKTIRIINLLECDILASGKLAIPDSAMDFVDGLIVSIHSSFNTPKEKMTERILSGLSNKKARIFAHPTGRLLNSRAGYEVEWDKLFTFVANNNKALEINSWPERLDLPDMLIRDALKKNIKFVIDTDSHALSHMDNMFYGVSVARRGWCEAKDILNTYSYKDFFSWLTDY